MVQVTADDKATLESWIRATTSEQRLVLRTLQKFIFCTTPCRGQRWSPSYPVGRNRPAFLVSADGQRGAKEEGHSQDGGRGYGGVLHPARCHSARTPCQTSQGPGPWVLRTPASG